MNQIDEYYFLVIKYYITLKSDLNLVKTYCNQTYILAVFNGERSKVILFSKISRFLHSTTQGSIRTDLIKK